MTKPLAAVVLECVVRIRCALESDCPETGAPIVDGDAIDFALADLEFAARNEPSGDSGELGEI